MNTYDATFFCKLFTQTARSSKSGVIPRDTGLLQDDSINTLFVTANKGVVGIGGEKGSLAYYAVYLENNTFVGRTNKINRHKDFVERFVKTEFINALKKYGTVTVK